ncbi:MAG: lipopolysaccharide heptosyltransferase II, partial [Gammaproteobacteria bacterium]
AGTHPDYTAGVNLWMGSRLRGNDSRERNDGGGDLEAIADFLPAFSVSSDAQANALQKMQLHLDDKPILALCPGAEFGPAKRWPAEYYATVANKKLAEGWHVWLFGSAKDKVITDPVMQLTEQRCENLAGRTSLGDSIDLLSLAKSVVTNDSGLMHIAAALNKPLIALYGPTSPGFTPPLSSSATILSTHLDCQPCFARICPLKHHRCMRELLPAQVVDILSKGEK